MVGIKHVFNLHLARTGSLQRPKGGELYHIHAHRKHKSTWLHQIGYGVAKVIGGRHGDGDGKMSMMAVSITVTRLDFLIEHPASLPILAEHCACAKIYDVIAIRRIPSSYGIS